MVWRNWSVRIGGGMLAVLLVVAFAAPWLGTVDPTLFDAASRDLRPGEVGSITTLDGGELRVRPQHLVDLVAAAHDRVERGHRLLKDHRHARAAQRSQPRFARRGDILAFE